MKMTMNPHDIPGTHRDNVFVPAIASSLGDVALTTWVAPFKCSVTGYNYSSIVAVTGHETLTVTLEVKGVNAGTTVQANYNINIANGLTAFVPVTMENVIVLDVEEGESLTFYNNEISTGNAGTVGPGTWTIEYEGR